jgi:endonuclease/exonuclease/phosphatase family metal-dependent hydrolase
MSHVMLVKLFCAISTVCACILSGCASNRSKTSPVTFNVGTWNLEFLGAEGNFRNNTPPRTAADHAAIGRKIAELGACVLAVQEINDEASLREVAAGAGGDWNVVLGTSGGWDDGKTAQRIGFVWDSAQVELLFAEELLQLPREFEGLPIFHRVPVTAGFRHKASGCDFRLVTVHMKAGQKADDARKRRGEATALANWLDALGNASGEDGDVLLLGDFNSTYGAEPEQLFEQNDRRRYLEPRTPSPTILHFADPIDHVVVGQHFQEVRRDSLAIDGDCDGLPREQWRKVYSDHFPVTATIVAREDDDPQAKFTRGPATQALPRELPPGARRTPAPAPATGAAKGPWPPAIGQRVRVLQLANGVVEGRLLAPLPEGAHGWIVLDRDGEVRAIPIANVSSITLL